MVTPRVGQQDSFKDSPQVVQLTVGCQEKLLGGNLEEEPKEEEGKQKHHAEEKYGSREWREEKKGQSYISNTWLAMLCTSPPIHPIFLLNSTPKNFS